MISRPAHERRFTTESVVTEQARYINLDLRNFNLLSRYTLIKLLLMRFRSLHARVGYIKRRHNTLANLFYLLHLICL